MRPKGLHELKVLFPESCFPPCYIPDKEHWSLRNYFFFPARWMFLFLLQCFQVCQLCCSGRDDDGGGGGSWFVRECEICSLPHQRARVHLSVCSASNSQLFPASLSLLLPPRPPLPDWSLPTSIVCQLPASVYWNIFPQRADFRGNEALLVGVCRSNPLPPSRNRMGTEWEVGGGLARRLALLWRNDPSTAAQAGPAPRAPTWPWMQSICLLLDLSS